MAKHEPQSASFDVPAIAEALGTRPATVHDVAYGEGVQYYPARGAARMEIFPRTGVTRLTAPGVRIELFDNARLDVSPSGVKFSPTHPGQDASLTVVPGGGIVFTLVAGGEYHSTLATGPAEPSPTPPPPPAPRARVAETPQEPRSVTADTSMPLPAGPGPDAPHAAREASSPETSAGRVTNQRPTGAETEQERIAVTGRLGRDPAFRTTATGSLVGRFPLAVHSEDGHTTWHTVLTFGTRAEQLQHRMEAGELTQGREVDVVGYLHVNTRPGKDGTPRTVQAVYAVAVKKR